MIDIKIKQTKPRGMSVPEILNSKDGFYKSVEEHHYSLIKIDSTLIPVNLSLTPNRVEGHLCQSTIKAWNHEFVYAGSVSIAIEP